jgi:hypothetical protein
MGSLQVMMVGRTFDSAVRAQCGQLPAIRGVHHPIDRLRVTSHDRQVQRPALGSTQLSD